MLNKVIMVCNLCKNPELRYTPQGEAVANLLVASTRHWKSKAGEAKEETCYITVIVWSKRAENCNEHLKKGSAIFVEGRLQSRSWEGQDGKKQYATEIVAEDLQFLDRTKEGTSPEEKPLEE